MFLRPPQPQPRLLTHYTDDELIRALQFDDNPQVTDLVKRLENSIDEATDALAQQKEEMKDWAIDCFTEHASEDFHCDVLSKLRHSLKVNKPEMIEIIKEVIEELEELDKQAGEMITAMRQDSAY